MTTTQNKRCVISFANRNGNYAQMLARLSDSLRENAPNIDFLAWTGEQSLGAPLHKDNPYAFKVYALEAAIKAGYESILWLDSSAYAVGDISPIFDIIDEQGYFFHPDGNVLGNWSSDKMLSSYELSRNEAISIPLVKGGMWGLNTLTNDTVWNIIRGLQHARKYGLFIGSWNNNDKTESNDERCRGHRHEMAVLSALVHKNKLKIEDGNLLIEHGGIYDAIRGTNIVIKYQGI